MLDGSFGTYGSEKFINYRRRVRIHHHLVLGGKSGSGKSTFVNSLLQRDIFKCDDVCGCTREPQTVFVQNTDIKDVMCGTLITDLPGIGEDNKSNEFLMDHKKYVVDASTLLYLIKADDRAYETDLRYLASLTRIQRSNVVIGVSQADRVEPFREWDIESRLPGKAQKSNLLRKCEDIAKRLQFPLCKIIPFSAKYGYNVDALLRVLKRKKGNTSAPIFNRRYLVPLSNDKTVPILYKIENKSVKEPGKALVIIPGMPTEVKSIIEYYYAITHAGWSGEIYHLMWDSETWRSFVIEAPIGTKRTKSQLRAVRKATKKIARKHLPILMTNELQGKHVTFVAHSIGAYMLYKLLKKPKKYPIHNTIEDVILLGGALSDKIKKLYRTDFRHLFNVYSNMDWILRCWEFGMKSLGSADKASSCGRHPIKDTYRKGISNINITGIVEDSHDEYQEVFKNGILRYNGANWVVDREDNSM